MKIDEQLIPHPYYPFPRCRAVRYNDGDGSYIRWYDLETGEEYPPYFGYGKEAQLKVNEWKSYRNILSK